MTSNLTAAKLDMHRAAIVWHTAALHALQSSNDLDAVILASIARDKHATYRRMLDRVAEEEEAIRTAWGGQPAERLPREESDDPDPPPWEHDAREIREAQL
jgi:hypothetical protein